MFQMKPKQRLCVAEQYLFYTDSDVSVHALLVVQSHISRRPRQIRYVGLQTRMRFLTTLLSWLGAKWESRLDTEEPIIIPSCLRFYAMARTMISLRLMWHSGN